MKIEYVDVTNYLNGPWDRHPRNVYGEHDLVVGNQYPLIRILEGVPDPKNLGQEGQHYRAELVKIAPVMYQLLLEILKITDNSVGGSNAYIIHDAIRAVLAGVNEYTGEDNG